MLSPLVAMLLASSPARAADAILYVVRHAEKATEPAADPALSAVGQTRAQALARTLSDVPLAAIHTTDTTRTRTTAAPIAAAKTLTTQTYDPPAALVAQIRASGGSHLVVGHSNTIGEIVKAAGGDAGPPVGELEFDRLYVVVVPDQGAATTVRLRYGP